MSDNDENIQSDDEINPKAHKALLQAVSKLGKTQHIRKPTRSEPALAQDEFHLVKTAGLIDSKTKIPDTSVSVQDLVKVLNKTNKHVTISKELTDKKKKLLLEKPLERPVAERIQRTIGYEKTVKSLQKWDAVVAANRSSDHQVFPLDYEEIHVEMNVPKKKPTKLSIKSDLMMEMEAVENKLKALKGESIEEHNDDDERKLQELLTKNELIARRKELAYLRTKESQKSAKARLQNKIKSKKYHKFLKREKMKEQIKEFEILQKTNPELALEKLEQIEKSRVLERANLRHKNTGTWAKNLQVRSKYDKDVRKDLSEQLALSRELTQKQKIEDDSDDEMQPDVNDAKENDDDDTEVDPFNPWIKVGKKSKNEVNEFVNNYRQYWTERNKNEKKLKEYKEGITNGHNDEILESDSESDLEEESKLEKFKKIMKEKIQISDDSSDESVDEVVTEKSIKKESSVQIDNEEPRQKKRRIRSKIKSKVKHEPKFENGWKVEVCEPDTFRKNLQNKNIDDIFDDAEDHVQEKLTKKLEKFANSVKESSKMTLKRRAQKQDNDQLENLKNLTFKKQQNSIDIDEELIELPGNLKPSNIKKINPKTNEIINNDETVDAIDPNKYANIRTKKLHTALPDMVNSSEFNCDENIGSSDDENDMKKMTIAEAFEDDDIIADFEKEKNDAKQDKSDELELSMPGWGSWTGSGAKNISQSKRLILKFPKKEKRCDHNKGKTVINDELNKQLKEHLVSDLPFPFTCVKDYEASIRAPIGRSFVPETAFRLLTRPEVVTKKGKIIEPMDETILVKKPKRPKTVVDVRIAKLNASIKT